MTPPPLVLASTSPRRRQLLREHRLPHRAVSPPVDDAHLAPAPTVNPHHWVAALAFLKAAAATDHLSAPRAVLLAADTVVVKDRRLIGQPRDADHAARIINALSGDSHEVLTGVALLTREQRTLLVDRSRVTVGPLDPPTIDAYVASGAWRGKAGAYNLSERIDEGWPITYQGDPTSIMGLPMRALLPRLASLGISPTDHP